MEPLYLDNAATTPIAPEVREAMAPWLEAEFGNPSSRHPPGVRAAEALDEARWKLARALGAEPEGIVFTAGGTEANNLAVLGLARAARHGGARAADAEEPTRSGHVLFGATEHPSVERAALALRDEGFEVERLRLTAGGALDLDDAAARVRADTVLVALMRVNNELGSVYPVRELAERVRARAPRARVHVDAVQAFGKLPVSLGELGADSLAVSSHKIHGPKGVGALALAAGVRPRPIVHGGGQEGGLRSGTENVAGIVGFARAAELALARAEETLEQARRAREVLREELASLPGARLLEPDGGAREVAGGVIPTIAAIQVGGPPAEVWLHHLESRGVYVSSGSACQAKSKELSPALLALGLGPEEARHVLRLSFAHGVRPEDVRRAAAELREIAARIDARPGGKGEPGGAPRRGGDATAARR